MNLGLAQAEAGDLYAAMRSQRMAVLLGKEHPEAHYDLALTEEHLGILVDAEREVQVSLRLEPGQTDARNLLGVIYAREGNTARAAQVWHDLIRETSDYEPARRNLAILGGQKKVADAMTAAAAPSFRRQPHEPLIGPLKGAAEDHPIGQQPGDSSGRIN